MQKLRNTIGLTQAGLADRLGVSWRTVAGWEAGSSYPITEHFKELIALAIQQQAFAVGHEVEEIRVLWKVAHQKTLLDERWLCALLDPQRCPQRQALQLHVEPEAVGESMTTAPPSGQEQGDRDSRTTDPSGGGLRTAAACPSPPPLGVVHTESVPRVDWSDALAVPKTPSQTNADQPQRLPIVGGEAEPRTLPVALALLLIRQEDDANGS
jgi:DNA-binding XRE family transcriptional regulator